MSEHPGRIFVLFVEPLGFLGLHTCHDASIVGKVSSRVGAPQGVHVPGHVINGVEHSDAAPVTDPKLDQGPTAALRMVMPRIPQTCHADDRIMDLAMIKPVFGG
jgi:hypothetical protein